MMIEMGHKRAQKMWSKLTFDIMNAAAASSERKTATKTEEQPLLMI
jgi:hypothetical protein